MQTFLAVTPGGEQTAVKFTRSISHVAYRIGPDSTLLRQNPPPQNRGGLLSISDADGHPIRNAGALCAAVTRECGRGNYSGVVLDFEKPPSEDRKAFVRQLFDALSRTRRTLYLPERYIDAAPGAVMLLCSAISGGNFSEYLQNAAARRRGGRLALDVERLRMDFRLPCPSGQGVPLGGEEFRRLTALSSARFFSPELCARYFTYIRSGETHFVLFDDAETLNRKVRIAAEMGFSAAFFMWPEVEDIAGSIRW